jgi:hypothetical protein
MRKNLFLGLIVASLLGLTSCDLLNSDSSLTEGEVIEGLKTALQVGTDSSVAVLSANNGYFSDAAVKILLPEEASTITTYAEQLGIGDLVDNAVLSINRAAEDAAPEAKTIFVDAITNLSISDAWDILNGTNPASTTKSTDAFDSTAATQYLRSTTYSALVSAFSPKIDNSLAKPLVGSYSTTEIWSSVTTPYNTFAESFAGQLLSLETVNVDLGEYVTEKALDGLFYKVGVAEREIRRDPLRWAASTIGDILKKVFGS